MLQIGDVILMRFQNHYIFLRILNQQLERIEFYIKSLYFLKFQTKLVSIIMRYLFLLCIVFCFDSCDNLSFQKYKNNEQIMTELDYTTVDASPSFKVCDTIIDKERKTACFGTNMRRKIFSSLSKHSITVKNSINETITVSIVIQSNREVKLSGIKASDSLIKEIPNLQKMIEKSIEDLPEIYPAIKRGIPVTTAYTIPIKIKLEN